MERANASNRRQRPAGFEPLVDLSSVVLVPKRSNAIFGDNDDDGWGSMISKGKDSTKTRPDDAQTVSLTVGLEWHARGLTSVVYKTRLPSAIKEPYGGCDACIKVTELDLLVRPHSAEREVACLSRLRGSSHVIELLDAFVARPDAFSTNYELIMPFLPYELGRFLDDPATTPQQWTSSAPPSLQRSSPSYAHFVARVASGLATGLQHIHSKQIAHRDIKPSNILLRHDGTPVYVDFATAWETYKASDSGSALNQSAYEGDDGRGGLECAVGTGAYRAPEVLFSPTDGYDVYKVDVWGLGVTLAGLFMPFEGDSSPGQPSTDSTAGGQSQGPGRTQANLKPARPMLWFENDATSSEDEDDHRAPSRRAAPPVRQTLFDGDRGEIALASSIFRILGLPGKQEEWPESATFRPTFDRLPFERATPSGPVTDFLPLASAIQASAADNEQDQDNIAAVLDIITECLQLSASRRPDSQRIVEHLTEHVKL